QPVPLGLNRDHATFSAFSSSIPNLATAPHKLTGDELLGACLDEGLAEPPAVSSSQQVNTERWFGQTAYCLSPARLFPMIEWQVRQWEHQNVIAGVEARSLVAVVSRWLDALAFAGRQATEQI